VRITPAASQRKILFKPTKKVIPVAVVKKNILAIQTLGDDMINRIESSALQRSSELTHLCSFKLTHCMHTSFYALE